MRLPYLVSIDDDPQVQKAIERDLKSRFRKEYRILSGTSAHEVLEALAALKQKGEEVALFLSDQRMPEMLGVDFLQQARKLYPEARRILLTAYSDIDAAIRAINDVQLDYYLSKPWDPPEEKLYPVISDLLEDWKLHYKPAYQGLRLVGFQFSPLSHELKDFLSGNLFPYQWLDAENQSQAKDLLTQYQLKENQLPLVVLEDGTPLSRPRLLELATRLGLRVIPSQQVYDVVIVGSGPAGLAAAVYGGSEGLKTLVIEKKAPGGQAGTSSRIENYLGFPSGLSGAELSRRALSQATRFGVEFLTPQEVKAITLNGQYKIVHLSDGTQLSSRSIVLATGVEYRQLDIPGAEHLTGAGIYYGAATTEAGLCAEKEVFVVGGGNSAGQGAMYLSRYARKVHLVIRRPNLSETMSQYLIDQIEATPHIELIPESELIGIIGEEKLEKVILCHTPTHTESNLNASAVFIFIGTKPRTDWIELDIIRDDKGFIVTGRDLFAFSTFKKVWKLERDPYLLETCSPGIFAAGDVRVGAMNRVASAVGEGTMAISFIHKYLAEN
jgi:thioredoxin reductase (NADPH)